jgi:Asp-tRNA(Asn)/Glu-tRNA(Gln) amidotransferase A subunit family amidase
MENAHLDALEKVLGLENTEDERTQMCERLSEQRDYLKTVRTSPLLAGFTPPAFHFDTRLAGTLLPPSSIKIRRAKQKRLTYNSNNNNLESLCFATVTELADLLKSQKITSLALTQMYLARLKCHTPTLLCVVNLCEERALAEAVQADKEISNGHYRGPLHGIPYGLKDLFAAVGTKTTFGTPPYQDQVWDYDATVTARLKEAGAVLVAKLSMGELAMGDVWFGGKTRTPWSTENGSSGSSAGSASAVAAGLVGFAIGTETLGSIISPCKACGTTGLRPTFGRVPRHGGMALSWTMDKVGPICRSVEDCALVFATIHSPDGHDKTVIPNIGFHWEPQKSLTDLCIGYVPALFEEADPTQKDALETLKQQRGVTLHPLTLPPMRPEYETLVSLILLTEGAAAFSDLHARGGLRELVQQDDWNWPNAFRAAATIPATAYINAQRIRTHLQHEMHDALVGIDVYVTPAGATPNLLYNNLCGQPSVVTRCGFTENNLPVMLEFCGNLFREDAALRLAFAYEQAAGFYKKTPEGF